MRDTIAKKDGDQGDAEDTGKDAGSCVALCLCGLARVRGTRGVKAGTLAAIHGVDGGDLGQVCDVGQGPGRRLGGVLRRYVGFVHVRCNTSSQCAGLAVVNGG